jgi:hypothetical protein
MEIKTSIIIKFTLRRTMMIKHWDVWRKPSTITNITLQRNAMILNRTTFDRMLSEV